MNNDNDSVQEQLKKAEEELAELECTQSALHKFFNTTTTYANTTSKQDEQCDEH